jgi:hypothetical protein
MYAKLAGGFSVESSEYPMTLPLSERNPEPLMRCSTVQRKALTEGQASHYVCRSAAPTRVFRS